MIMHIQMLRDQDGDVEVNRSTFPSSEKSLFFAYFALYQYVSYKLPHIQPVVHLFTTTFQLYI